MSKHTATSEKKSLVVFEDNSHSRKMFVDMLTTFGNENPKHNKQKKDDIKWALIKTLIIPTVDLDKYGNFLNFCIGAVNKNLKKYDVNSFCKSFIIGQYKGFFNILKKVPMNVGNNREFETLTKHYCNSTPKYENQQQEFTVEESIKQINLYRQQKGAELLTTNRFDELFDELVCENLSLNKMVALHKKIIELTNINGYDFNVDELYSDVMYVYNKYFHVSTSTTDETKGKDNKVPFVPSQSGTKVSYATAVKRADNENKDNSDQHDNAHTPELNNEESVQEQTPDNESTTDVDEFKDYIIYFNILELKTMKMLKIL